MSGDEQPRLTDADINRLCAMLRDSAQDKMRRARTVHDNDRADMEAAAMRDYELRKKLIAMKSTVQAAQP